MLWHQKEEAATSGQQLPSFAMTTEKWKVTWKKSGKMPQNSADFLTLCRRRRGKKKKNKIFLKNYKNFLDFLRKVAYNNSCVENTDAQLNRNALLAQLVEHLTLNQGVQGSSP